MVQMQAKDVTLRDLTDNFKLQLVQDESFFLEWQEDLPALTDSEREYLDRVRAGYFNLITDLPLIEKTIQLVVLSPLFFLAGFYLPPFQIKAEKSIEITADDEGTIIRGQIDILLIKDQFWVMAIESKRASFSIEAGLAQLLSYMLANPHPDRPGFGTIASGSDYIFVKLVSGETARYSTSAQFAMRNRNDLYE
ncbi:MAG: restriction endonuclease subunit R, partial [Phormidesmis sp. CAN_BIN44]|nr:restriction endonuclease subunit R [Phormidesmis sp. CAN_BIN44]